jgi:hypothetical protein
MSKFTRLVLVCIMTLSLLWVGCSQKRTVEGVVYYKTVSGMKGLLFCSIARNGASDGVPFILVDAEEQALKDWFPSEGDLVVDNSTEMRIDEFYTKVVYMVSIHVMTTDGEYRYYLAYNASRGIFNELQVGAKVKLETSPTDNGPTIVRIVG